MSITGKCYIIDAGMANYFGSNIYLHYVLDEWFIEAIQTWLKGNSILIRYADDFLLLFSNKEDAERLIKVLVKLSELIVKGKSRDRN